MRFPDQVVLATRNRGKQAELQRILVARNITCEVLTLEDFPGYTDEVLEDAADFEGNALLKAQAAFAATGVAALADDSGLCVDALNGMPGVLSARWSGRRDDALNLELVLAQMRDVPDERRTAAFVAAVAYVAEGGIVVTRGEMRGTILREPRGSGGFGYDPIFVAEGLQHTNAEVAPEVKDARSHRRQALDALLEAVTL
ncbi:MAG: RdgB/HAM1 family non-canonical purine NTP pyrophosphatase [Actinomycetales bacterium]|nr:RdgB/HAM1 family non-canonical purine NTP pyrophosphatase [Actinomycetales bacterium]